MRQQNSYTRYHITTCPAHITLQRHIDLQSMRLTLMITGKPSQHIFVFETEFHITAALGSRLGSDNSSLNLIIRY